MERFAFKIDNVLRDNLYKLCRLCGMAKPEMLPIIGQPVEAADDEPDLCRKVLECAGIQVITYRSFDLYLVNSKIQNNNYI